MALGWIVRQKSLMSRSRNLAVAAAIILVALALLPFVAEKFAVQFATRILIMAIFAMSLNLLVGQAGLVSLGHAAFFGIAGYCLALSSPQYQAANFWTSLPLAMIAVGMLALSGFPLLFSGFWSKDEILRAAHGWGISQAPFYLGLTGALLTAFWSTGVAAFASVTHCEPAR